MFDEMTNDTIDVLNQDGTPVAENLKASVQGGNFVYLPANGLLVQPNYLIVRKLSNGGEERYRVIEPNFYEGDDTFEAHYQMKVSRAEVADKAPTPPHIFNINMSGHGSRFNFQSADNSVNYMNVDSQVTQHIENLRKEITKSNLLPDEKEEALDIVDQVEKNTQSQKPKKTIVEALLGALPHAAKFAAAISVIVGCFG